MLVRQIFLFFEIVLFGTTLSPQNYICNSGRWFFKWIYETSEIILMIKLWLRLIFSKVCFLKFTFNSDSKFYENCG